MTQHERDARFEQTFNLYYDAVLRYCLRRLPTPEASDAAADVFVVAWRRIDAAPRDDRLLPWLYGIARNVVRNAHRSQRRRRRLTARLEGLSIDRPREPDTIVVSSEDAQRALDELASMTEGDQEVLRLRAFEHLDTSQIAAVLGCSPGAARKRLDRATKRLARKVGNPEPTPRPHPVRPREEVTDEHD